MEIDSRLFIIIIFLCFVYSFFLPLLFEEREKKTIITGAHLDELATGSTDRDNTTAAAGDRATVCVCVCVSTQQPQRVERRIPFPLMRGSPKPEAKS
jgi:hypothetical protein